MATAYGVHYRVYVVKDEDGKRVRQLQTESDGRFAAQSQIGASNPSYPLYDSLWGNYNI